MQFLTSGWNVLLCILTFGVAGEFPDQTVPPEVMANCDLGHSLNGSCLQKTNIAKQCPVEMCTEGKHMHRRRVDIASNVCQFAYRCQPCDGSTRRRRADECTSCGAHKVAVPNQDDCEYEENSETVKEKNTLHHLMSSNVTHYVLLFLSVACIGTWLWCIWRRRRRRNRKSYDTPQVFESMEMETTGMSSCDSVFARVNGPLADVVSLNNALVKARDNVDDAIAIWTEGMLVVQLKNVCPIQFLINRAGEGGKFEETPVYTLPQPVQVAFEHARIAARSLSKATQAAKCTLVLTGESLGLQNLEELPPTTKKQIGCLKADFTQAWWRLKASVRMINCAGHLSQYVSQLMYEITVQARAKLNSGTPLVRISMQDSGPSLEVSLTEEDLAEILPREALNFYQAFQELCSAVGKCLVLLPPVLDNLNDLDTPINKVVNSCEIVKQMATNPFLLAHLYQIISAIQNNRAKVDGVSQAGSNALATCDNTVADLISGCSQQGTSKVPTVKGKQTADLDPNQLGAPSLMINAANAKGGTVNQGASAKQ